MMRLQATFIALLLLASTATSVAWAKFEEAREGDSWARAVVFALALIAAATLVLLGRIVLRVRGLGAQQEAEK